MESKDINRRDAYGNLHGYWEWHFNISQSIILILKGCYNHGYHQGCWERSYCDKSNNDVLTTMEYYL